jgi:hypothetical protein
MKYFLIALAICVASCSSKKQYDPSLCYDKAQQQWMLSRIIAHVYIAPPYVLTKDRLKLEYNEYYLNQTLNFDLQNLYITDDSTHYYLVKRPASGNNHRAVGGTFNVKGKELVNFKEIFITPALPDSILTERSMFLFDQMVRGDIEQFLKMPSYVQWPNEISFYDTVEFEWKLKPGSVGVDSMPNQ